MKIKDYYSEELQAFAAEYLRFDFEKGEIYWKKSRGNQHTKAGSRAGTVKTDERNGKGKQYRDIKLVGKHYIEHRLLFCFFHKSSFEGLEIDHIDQNSLNNRIENLRAVTQSVNQKNAKQSKNNTSGYNGVHWDESSQKWMARIEVNGKRIHSGSFTKKRDAIFRRKLAEIAAGYHPNHGRAKNQN